MTAIDGYSADTNLFPDLAPESRFTDPTGVCPDPQRWSSMDSDSTELEVSVMVGGLVRALQPEVVVETGTAFGQTAHFIGNALRLNGHGQLLSYEIDPERVRIAQERCSGLDRVTVVQQSSVDALSRWQMLRVRNGTTGPDIDFAWLDSLFNLRGRELELITPLMAPLGIVGIHDAGNKYAPFRNAMLASAQSLGWNAIEFPTPRGMLLLGRTLWKP